MYSEVHMNQQTPWLYDPVYNVPVCVHVSVFLIHSDSGSGVSTISYGLGRSSRDVQVQDWRSIPLVANGIYQVTATVPNGVNVWVRVQVGNRGRVGCAYVVTLALH